MDSLFVIKGIVVHGKNRGKKLGFPTANLSIASTTPQGTYVSEVIVHGKTYKAVTFIGTVDTFNEKDFVAEAYILGFAQDIYGEEIIINILKKLRDNQKFDSVEALVEQMKQDEIETKEFFSSNPSRQEA